MTRQDEDGKADYRLDDQIGYVLRLASQRHAAIFQALSEHGLTPTQFSALIRIDEVGPCSQNQLGRLTAMDVATIKGVVDRLRRKGFVGLSPDPTDKRRTTIALTAEGAAMMGDLRAMGHRVTRETLAPLDRDDQRRLLELLARLA